jgi:hypothetical protein
MGKLPIRNTFHILNHFEFELKTSTELAWGEACITTDSADCPEIKKILHPILEVIPSQPDLDLTP